MGGKGPRKSTPPGADENVIKDPRPSSRAKGKSADQDDFNPVRPKSLTNRSVQTRVFELWMEAGALSPPRL